MTAPTPSAHKENTPAYLRSVRCAKYSAPTFSYSTPPVPASCSMMLPLVGLFGPLLGLLFSLSRERLRPQHCSSKEDQRVARLLRRTLGISPTATGFARSSRCAASSRALFERLKAAAVSNRFRQRPSRAATSSAMARLEVSPGDSMP